MAIDDARLVGPRTTTKDMERRRARLQRVIRGNEASVMASHVLYNIGKERREWLLQYLKHTP